MRLPGWQNAFCSAVNHALFEAGIDDVASASIDRLYEDRPELTFPAPGLIFTQVMHITACSAWAVVHGFDPGLLVLSAEEQRAAQERQAAELRAAGVPAVGPEQAERDGRKDRQQLFDLNRTRIAAMAKRGLMQIPSTELLAVLCADIDDPRWRPALALLMPNLDLNARRPGGTSTKLVTVPLPGLRARLAQVSPTDASKLDVPSPGGRVRVLVLTGLGADVFHVVPAEDSQAS
jgi:hypothetical protein